MFRRRRKTPPDTSALHTVLRTGSVDQLDGLYSSSMVDYDGYAHGSLLTIALGNSSPTDRAGLAHRLLDDGADVTQHYPLHVFLASNARDAVPDVPLLERLLEHGADVNGRCPRFGETPLETLATKFKFSDADLQPLYDVLLSRSEIDVLRPGLDGRLVLVNLRNWYALRGSLVEQVEEMLRRRGITPPESPLED